MSSKELLRLVPSALTIVLLFYGCVYFIVQMFTSFLPLGLLLVSLIIFGVYSLRAPQAPQEAVEALIGKDLLDNETQEGYVLKTIAHRGAGLDAPENTLEAFDQCHAQGCNFIELDVTITKDEIPIIFHDATLERMADSNLVVRNATYEELRNIDLSIKHPLRDKFGKTNIPTLDQAVTRLLANGQKMIIDIKDNDKKMVNVILNLFVTYPNLYSNAMVSSFFPNILYWIRKSDSKIICSLAYRPHIFANEYFKYPEGKGPDRASQFWKNYFFKVCDSIHTWALPRLTYYLIGLSVILLHKDCLSAEQILQWRKKGVRVMAWTVNSPIEKQHFVRNLRITYLTDTFTGELTVHL